MKPFNIDENIFKLHYQNLQFHDLNGVTEDNIKSLFREMILLTQRKPRDASEYEALFQFIQQILNDIDRKHFSLLKDRSAETFGADLILLYIIQTKEYDTKALDESYLRDYLITNSLLKNTDLCKSILDNLESNLQAWVDSEEYKNYQPEVVKREKDPTRTGPSKMNTHFFLPLKSHEKQSEKFKILTSFFQHWASKNGYKFAKVKGLLDEGDFFTLVGEGRLIGDKGVLESHGEWPHVIQQFIISEYYKGKYEPKLTHTPIDLYSKLGQPECHSGVAKAGLWDDLHDQQEDTRPKMDFRSPERLIDFMKSKQSETQYPLLSACIQREDFGFKKREHDKTGGRSYYGVDKITRLDEEDIKNLFTKK